MALMTKYDKAEAHAKWLASPEYARLQEQKAHNATDDERKTAKQK